MKFWIPSRKQYEHDVVWIYEVGWIIKISATWIKIMSHNCRYKCKNMEIQKESFLGKCLIGPRGNVFNESLPSNGPIPHNIFVYKFNILHFS
jgi:hypothetical protein